MKTYLFTFSGAMLLAMAATPVVIMLTHRFNLVDARGARKVHAAPVARLGGIAIFIATIGMVLPVLMLRNVIGESFRVNITKIIALLIGCSIMFVVGMIDDLKGMRVRYKLLGELIAAAVICSLGIRIHGITAEGLFSIDFGLATQWALTMFWVVGVTNAVNIIDGLDGLAAGISAIACGVIAILAIHAGQSIMAILMLALLGAIVGFLFFNFNPAKIFMGDCGSLFLGFALASSSVLCTTKSHTIVGMALPILVLGIPIFDTLFSMLRRFLERRSVFAPDRAHFHHRLLDYGLGHQHVAVVAYIITATVGGLGLFMIYTQSTQTLVVFACLLFIIVLIFRLVGSVRLFETIAGLKTKYRIRRQVREEVSGFEEVQLHFRQAKTFDQWWQAVCLAGDKLGADGLALEIVTRNRQSRQLTWHRNGPQPAHVDSDHTLRTVVPINDRRTNSSLRLIVDIRTDGSLESAGRRAALFSRLLDEHSLADRSANKSQ